MKTFINFISESINNQAYKVTFIYDGDEISNYEGAYIVIANSSNEAIKKAKNEAKESDIFYDKDPRFFKVEDKYSSVDEYKKKFPKSNVKNY